MKYVGDGVTLLPNVCPLIPSPSQEGASNSNPHMLFEKPLWHVEGVACPNHNEASKPRRRRKKAKTALADLKKRRLTTEQLNFLEVNFGKEQKLRPERKVRIASEIGLDPRQVAVWFQNRRVRWKSKQLEEDYHGIKASYEAAKEEKFKLEIEVAKLKEVLAEAQQEVCRLTEKNRSPSSSTSLDVQHTFGVEFEVHQQDYILFTSDNTSFFAADWCDASYFGLL